MNVLAQWMRAIGNRVETLRQAAAERQAFRLTRHDTRLLRDAGLEAGEAMPLSALSQRLEQLSPHPLTPEENGSIDRLALLPRQAQVLPFRPIMPAIPQTRRRAG